MTGIMKESERHFDPGPRMNEEDGSDCLRLEGILDRGTCWLLF
jgi:hypothetical protein